MFLRLRLVSISFILSILWHNALSLTTHAMRGQLFSLGWAVLCKFQPNSYDCSLNETSEARFYYDIKLKDCGTFEYSDCDQSYNNFMTLSSCSSQCRWSGLEHIGSDYAEKIYCRFQPDFGDCNSYYPMYYYDISERKCKGFSYSGCGGNNNKFSSKRLCAAVCGAVIPYPKNVDLSSDLVK